MAVCYRASVLREAGAGQAKAEAPAALDPCPSSLDHHPLTSSHPQPRIEIVSKDKLVASKGKFITVTGAWHPAISFCCHELQPCGQSLE